VENWVHVITTNIAILTAITYIIIEGKRNFFSVILVASFFVFTLFFLIFKVSNRTYWIEIYCFAVIYLHFIYFRKFN
jgi:hypothetical protein